MKSNAQQSFYFSAYPLKALKTEPSAEASTQSPFLKTVLNGKARTMSRVRVFPMINPYRQSATPVIPKASKLPTDIEMSEKGWFNNYE